MHLRRLRLAAFLLLAAAPAFADDIDERAERQRIARERDAVQARHAADEAECRGRFLVTRCLDEAKSRRREALERLRHEELVLDDAARKRRASARLQAIEARQRELAERPPAPALPAPVIREAAQRRLPAALPGYTASDADAAARRDAEAAKAARRVQSAERLRRQAADDRARIAEREAARAARGKAVDPLPATPEIPRD